MIRVYRDPEEISAAAAMLFTVAAERAVSAGGTFSVALAGGDTPRRAYEMLSQEPLRNQIPWQFVHFFWGDERCVPAEDPRLNALMASQALLQRVPVPPENIHAIRYADSPAMAADEYEGELRHFFAGKLPRFDFVFLGLGTDGHTASLFPGEGAGFQNDRWVVAVAPPHQTVRRITLSAQVFNHAAFILFMVSGSEKATTLKEVFFPSDPLNPLPASRIRPTDGTLLWLLDQDAARMLDLSETFSLSS